MSAASRDDAGGGLVEVIVAIDDAHLGDIARVLDELVAAGLHSPTRLDALGVVTGRARASHLDGLGAVTGVASVERSRGFQLPPDGSPVQ